MGVLRRYKSEIYGNYRKACVLNGLVAGGILFAVVLFCKLIYYPIYAPESYVTDITLLAANLFFAYRYRNRLTEKKVSFKELMLFGLGLGVTAAAVYGLSLLFYGGVIDHDFSARCLQHFVNGELNGNAPEEQKAHTIEVMQSYKLYTWAFIGFFRTAVMSIMSAFIAALIFRTEKPIIRQSDK